MDHTPPINGLIRQVQQAEYAIFGDFTPLSVYAERLKNAGLIVLENDGFLVGHLRNMPDGTRVPYLWLCGVCKKSRGKGVFSKMFQVFRQFYNNYSTFSVRTYPGYYTTMYGWISKRGALQSIGLETHPIKGRKYEFLIGM